MEIPPPKGSRRKRGAPADFPRSETFAAGMDAIADGATPFQTTVFE